jgi:hypothetical protein
LVFFTAVLLLAFATGCGDDADSRFAVRGQVTLDGKPLDKAVIMFVPVESGKETGAEIQNGRYTIAAEDGLSPGRYRVKIMPYIAPDFSHFGSGHSQQPPAAPEKPPNIPSRYQTGAELEAVATVDGDNQFDYELHSTR